MRGGSVKRPLKPGVFGHASFEIADGIRVGRIRLDRWWDPSLDLAFGRPCDDHYRPLVIIGMNPSDACGEFDDPMIGKGIEFARRAGANGLVMVNVTPEVTPYPDDLGSKLMPYGCDERQWEAIDGAISEPAVCVVAAWGKEPRGVSSWRDRVAKIRAIAADVGRELMCFGTNEDGSPKHPGRIAYSTPIVPWRRA